MATTKKEQAAPAARKAAAPAKTSTAAKKPAAKSSARAKKSQDPAKVSPATQKPEEKRTVESEIARLTEIYKNLSPKRLALAQGLIVQAARIRVNLDDLSADIALNGKTEMFQQSEKAPPYERTRPAADLFLKFDKNHSSIIKQLNDMLKDDTPVEPEDDFSSFRT